MLNVYKNWIRLMLITLVKRTVNNWTIKNNIWINFKYVEGLWNNFGIFVTQKYTK